MGHLIVPFLEVKEDASTPGRFKGYGSTFGNVDLGKDICAKGCFKRTLEEHSKGGTLPAMYWMHDRKEPIGDWLDVREDSRGLVVEGQLWLEAGIENAKKAYMMMKGTGPKGMSIGYSTRKAEYDDKKGTRTLLDVDLPEVSIVGYGMNPKALVTSIKSHLADGIVPTVRDLEALLRDAGLSEKMAKTLLAKGYDGLRRDGADEDAKANAEALKALRNIHRLFLADEC